MSTKVEAPPPRDYGQETRSTLEAQLELAPDLYNSESTWRPQYAALDRSILAESLRGSPDAPGLLELYERDIQPVLSRVESADRADRVAGELDVLRDFAPDVVAALRDASGTGGLTRRLTEEAERDLDLGASLDPSLAHTVAQGVRGGQAARGMGWGLPDAVMEGYTLGDRGQALRRERRDFAGRVVGINQATAGDPLMAILGRPSMVTGMTPGVAGQGAGMVPGGVFNPESGYARDVFDTNYNADAAARIASANNRTALIGAGISAAGSLGGGAMKGGTV